MAFLDLPLNELETYRPFEKEPLDFDVFWTRTLEEEGEHPIAPVFKPVEDPLYATVEVEDVTFRGFHEEPVKAWLLLPPGAGESLPALVTYRGYGNGRSLPLEHLGPVAAGFAHLVMDTRGQGTVGSPGHTKDPHGSGPHYPGFMTSGIASRNDYYYRRVFVDAVHAVKAAAAHPKIDGARLAVTGISQGGGIALAAAALAPDRVKLLMADVPFLCHFRRALELAEALPYTEITSYLACHRDRAGSALDTLAYFDGIHFAPRVQARTLFSVALMDGVCPPSTVFGAYNRITAEKEIRVYPYNGHEGGGPFQEIERLQFAREHL